MSDDLRSAEVLISDREREILRLVATGATNQEIAQQLHISINTVKKHLSNIFGKIGVESRTEATLYAVHAGLVPMPRTTSVASMLTPAATAPDFVEEDAEEEPLFVEAQPSVDTALVPSVAHEGEVLLAAAPVPPVDQVPVAPTIVVPAPPQQQPRPRWLLPLLVLLAVFGMVTTWALLRPAAAPAATPTLGDAAALLDTERFRLLAPLPMALTNFALANVNYDGRRYLYAIGGETANGVSDQVLRYDIESNVWSPFRPKPTAVSDVQAAVVGGKIYVPGGRQADGTISTVLEAYDPQRDRWETLAPLPVPRSHYALVAVEGKIYLFGGWDGQAFSDQVWQYSPDSDSWEERSAMPTARADAGAVAVNDQVFIIGGVNENGDLSTNERYNPAEDGVGNPWAVSPPLDAARSNFAIADAGSLVFVFGGGPGLAPALLFKPIEESWQVQETAFDGSRQGLRAQAVGDQIFIGGGRTDAGLSDEFAVYQAIYSQVLPMR
jgi:DNA-binding CsgD family transcriptional regulator